MGTCEASREATWRGHARVMATHQPPEVNYIEVFAKVDGLAFISWKTQRFADVLGTNFRTRRN